MELDRICLGKENNIFLSIKFNKSESAILNFETIKKIDVKYDIYRVFNLSHKVNRYPILIGIKDLNFLDNTMKFSIDLEELKTFKGINIKFYYVKFFFIEKQRKIVFTLNKSFSLWDLLEDVKKERYSPKSITSINNIRKIHQIHEGPQVREFYKNSYEDFEKNITENKTNIIIQEKKINIISNLKTFGVSLLCRILLLIKYLNEIVGNEINQDIFHFLNNHIINKNILETR